MKLLDIGVVTPTHPARNRQMLQFANMSVWKQEHPASGHFIVNDTEKRGAAWTRQKALESNPFKWTAFLDSDDWFAPQHLRRLAEEQIESGADYVYSWFWVHNAALGGVLPNDPVFPPTHFTEPWDKANPRHTTITVLVRTELALEVGFHDFDPTQEFSPGNVKGEDWQFTLKCNELGTIHHFPERTWYWRHHGMNTSGLPDRGDG